LGHAIAKSEKIATLEKRFFWTLPQFTLLNDEAKKRVLFISDFGTGKTSLLRAKAKQLLAKGEQVVIISIEDRESSTESLLTIQLRAEFEDKKEATVISLKGTGIS
jgi:type II secretory pathway predicted ATPase ExeA